MNLHSCIVGSLVGLSFSLSAQTTREWTSSDGRTLQAVIRKATPDSVTLALTNGQQVELPLARFSQRDQTYVADWLENEKRLADHFSLVVTGSRSIPVKTFLKNNADDSVGKGVATLDGTVVSRISIMEAGRILYAVEARDGEMLVEVGLRLMPPATLSGAATLDFDKLTLVYRNRDRTEGNSTVGPRWLDGESVKLGTHVSVATAKGKPAGLGVGFVIPKDSTPIALRYVGTATLAVPLR